MPGSTPVYGFPYPDPSDLVANYPALGQDLAEDVEGSLPGIKGELISYSTIPAKLTVGTNGQVLTADSAQATGLKWSTPSGGLNFISTASSSAVAATNVTSAFSATYDSYVIVLTKIAGSVGSNQTFTFSLLAGSTEATTNYQFSQQSINTAGTQGLGGSSGAANWQLGPVVAGNNASAFIVVNDPFLTDRTFFDGNLVGGYNSATAAITNYYTAGVNTNGSSYDGFRLAIASGTFSCTIRIYGLQNS